jgi:hypothetical protein
MKLRGHVGVAFRQPLELADAEPSQLLRPVLSSRLSQPRRANDLYADAEVPRHLKKIRHQPPLHKRDFSLWFFLHTTPRRKLACLAPRS